MKILTPQAFEKLVEQYYKAWFRFHPELAIQVGVEGLEDKLTPFDDEAIGALISLNQKLICSLDELNFSELSRLQQLDYHILGNSANLELHDLLDRDWRYLMPQAYLPVDGIHQLLNRPVNNVHQALKHRLQAVPEYLRSAKSFLKGQAEKIPANWVLSAITGATSGAEYFRDLLRNPDIKHIFTNPARLQPVFDDAAKAMEDFATFLQRDIKPLAQGTFACGEGYFNLLLKDRHDLDINADQLYQFGETLFNQTQKELQALCEELPGSNEWQEQLAAIREQHPEKGEALLEAYRDRMKAALKFVEQHQLVTLPQVQALKIIETPVFQRHEIPFAAYEEPSYKDPAQKGFYFVTPVRSDGDLLEHNWASIDLTCVHEAFPGHHLQFVSANINTENSLPRLLNPSASLYEGWALYCEEMMQEQGFLDKPEHRFMMLRDRLWRALRVMLDVQLHCRNLSIDEAASKMCKILGFTIDQAKADLSWYSQCPTVPMAYATGWALIKALREEQSKKPDFSLKQFHDDLLSVGSCALPLVIKYKFGEEAWLKAKHKVFNTG